MFIEKKYFNFLFSNDTQFTQEKSLQVSHREHQQRQQQQQQLDPETKVKRTIFCVTSNREA